MDRNNDSVKELISCFNQSFVNEINEFVCLFFYGDECVNSYFWLGNVSNELELKCKVLEHLSRPAHKGFTFAGQSGKEKQLGEEIYKYHLEGINKFLGTNFSSDDIEQIYTKLGVGCNRKLCIEFIESGYNMELLEE